MLCTIHCANFLLQQKLESFCFQVRCSSGPLAQMSRWTLTVLDQSFVAKGQRSLWSRAHSILVSVIFLEHLKLNMTSSDAT